MNDIAGKFRKWLLEKDKWGLLQPRTEMCHDTLEIGFFYGHTIAQKELEEQLSESNQHIRNLLKPYEGTICLHDQEGKCQEHENYSLDTSCHIRDACAYLEKWK